MKFLFFLISFVFVGERALSQDTTAWKPIVDINNSSWNIKVTNGVQSSYFFDIGLSKTTFLSSSHGMYGTALSIAYSMFPNFNNSKRNIQGLKLSGEFFGNLFGLGLDLSYYNSNNQNDFFVSPKALFGVSHVNFYYSYAFSTNNSPLTMIGRHAIALSLNLPFYWNDKLRRQKTWGFNTIFRK